MMSERARELLIEQRRVIGILLKLEAALDAELRQTARMGEKGGLEGRLRSALEAAGDVGLTRTEIRRVAGNHVTKAQLDGALMVLGFGGEAQKERIHGRGKPVEVWRIISSPAPVGGWVATGGERSGA